MAMIWIVEDDRAIGTLIEMTMQKASHETRWLKDGLWLDHALEDGDALPDLMLLDLMLRAKSGYQILKEWKASARTAQIPVIILSAKSTEDDKVRGLELGAEDYVTKPFGVRELQARVSAALRRIRPKPARITAGPLTLTEQTREVSLDGHSIDLTAMEFDLLLYLVRHAGHTVSRAELLKEVWGYASGSDPSRTVDSHIKTLRLKLGDTASDPKRIQTVRGTGYRFISEPSESR